MNAAQGDIRHFDRKLVAQRRARAAARLADHDFLFTWALREMTDRIGMVRRKFPRILIHGARGDRTAQAEFIKSAGGEFTATLDISPSLLSERKNSVAADEEYLPFAPASFDLIVSNLALHTVNDLPGALIQMRRALKPDGLFLAAMPGGETLYQLRRCLMEAELSLYGGVSPRVAPFADKQQAGALMQRASFALPVVDSEIVTVTYENIFRLFADLRGMGETNTVIARSRRPAGRALFAETARLYAERHAAADGRIEASFEIVFMTGWAPHETQQKPLKPGSAAKSLADALGTVEIAGGEKARP